MRSIPSPFAEPKSNAVRRGARGEAANHAGKSYHLRSPPARTGDNPPEKVDPKSRRDIRISEFGDRPQPVEEERSWTGEGIGADEACARIVARASSWHAALRPETRRRYGSSPGGVDPDRLATARAISTAWISAAAFLNDCTGHRARPGHASLQKLSTSRASTTPPIKARDTGVAGVPRRVCDALENLELR